MATAKHLALTVNNANLDCHRQWPEANLTATTDNRDDKSRGGSCPS